VYKLGTSSAVARTNGGTHDHDSMILFGLLMPIPIHTNSADVCERCGGYGVLYYHLARMLQPLITP
jgi:hypothetical protein